MKNFHIVKHNLFRGGSPNIRDIIDLQNKFGVEKIISLDQKIGLAIKPVCDKLGIKQIIINIKPTDVRSLQNLLQYNIWDLISNKIPTFVHCRRGKDRTGLLIALARCIIDGWAADQAIKEAKKLGFGTGLDFEVEKLYINLIKKSANHMKDQNAIDDSDNGFSDDPIRDNILDPYAVSWGTYVDPNINYYPYSSPYTSDDEWQYPVKSIYYNYDNSNVDQIPLIGVSDTNSQITNWVGPSLVGGGFV